MIIGCEKDGKKLNFFKISHFSMEIFSDDNKSNEFARTKTNLAILLNRTSF